MLTEHGTEATIPDDPAARADAQNAWHQTLYEAGYIGLSFPVEYGGHGKPPIYEAILNDELGRAGAHRSKGSATFSNALRLFATGAQRDRIAARAAFRARYGGARAFTNPRPVPTLPA